MIKIILMICAGAVAGAVLGSTRSPDAACCPLTATPWRGALYGACLAAFAAFAFVGVGRSREAKAGPPSKYLLHIASTEQFDLEVLGASEPILVDFYADWCGPCKRLAPIMSELADDLVGQAKVAKVNVDEQAALAQRYGVSSIPDVRLFKGGKEISAVTGLRDKRTYLSLIKEAGKAEEPAAPAE